LASLTLFHGWRSSASRRVRLCLAEKGLAFDSKVIDLVKGEHHSPEFLKLNPNGVIPLLILEDGRALYESGTICEYVDEIDKRKGGFNLLQGKVTVKIN
jgi:glutathione S-transferase